MTHVLVATPNPTTRQLVATWLQTAGYAVTVVAHGLDVISVLPHVPQRLVLVLDQHMPHFSGSEIAQLIVTIPRPHQYRFIFMTAHAHDQNALAPISRRLHAPILVTPFPAATLLRALAAIETDRVGAGDPSGDGEAQQRVRAVGAHNAVYAACDDPLSVSQCGPGGDSPGEAKRRSGRYIVTPRGAHRTVEHEPIYTPAAIDVPAPPRRWC